MALKILLVEDDLDLGELVCLALSRHGIEADWFVRARQDSADQALVLMNADGVECKPVAYNWDSAVVDGRLKGSALSGLEVVKILKKKGLFVVAASGDPWLNKEMVAGGADIGMEKFDLFTRAISDPHQRQRLFPSTKS